MRIGIDARPLSSTLTGIGYVFLNIIKWLEKFNSSDEFYCYSYSDFQLPFKNPRWKKRIGKGYWAGMGSLWILTQGGKYILQDKPHVYWAPWPIVPPYLPMKTAITIHDFNWWHCPETMELRQWMVHSLLGNHSVRKASAVFAVSQSTLNDVLKLRSENNVYLTPNAVNDAFRPLDRIASANEITAKFNCSPRYILAVGTVEPRKNLITLLQSFRKLKDRYHIPQQLLIVGAKGWKDSDIFNEYKKLRLENDVVFPGYIPDADMPKLYSGAELLIFPSIYEGFGLPVLEAMACGCPVVASNRSSIPEIVGDSGLLVEPMDTEAIAEGIQKLLNDENFRKDCCQKGLARAKLFSWEKTARKIHDVLLELAAAEAKKR